MLASSVAISPALQRAPVQAVPSSSQLQLLNAFGLRGVDAITYSCKSKQFGRRPRVKAFLRRLPVEGMNT